MAKGKKQRAEFIKKRARELANSGDHVDHTAIEFALLLEGYPEAHEVLDDRGYLRQTVDNLCQAARAKKRHGQC